MPPESRPYGARRSLPVDVVPQKQMLGVSRWFAGGRIKYASRRLADSHDL
jgi:hypothetical protein